MGGIRRRFGQYDQAVKTLLQALEAFEHASPIVRAKILGELGVVYRHSNEFSKAQKVFNDQYRLARETALEAEAELCRAIGNEGMSAYNLSQQKQPNDTDLLNTAFDQLRERIRRAQDLHQRLLKESPKSRYVDLSKSWETIGMDRLTLCHIAAGDTAEAVRLAEESQRSQTGDDPTIRAFSRFFYGNALWSNGQHDEALQQWNAPPGTCASAMALCKEPSAEHTEYLKLLAQAGVDFDSYDEQGFSALDYAVLSDNQDAKQMIEIILDAFRKFLRQTFEGYIPKLSGSEIKEKVEEEIAMRTRQAQLRRQYRAILQEHIRPELRTENSDSIQKLRTIYAKLLSDPSKQTMFDAFHYVKYSDFQKLQRLPLSTDRLTKRFPHAAGEIADEDEDHFIIFFSYRWIGRTSDPPIEGPDDDNDTQWRRMMNAIDEFLKKRRDVKPKQLSLWLVSFVFTREASNTNTPPC
jgi:tetratricopeptide (TPR) repeat protein